MLVVIEELLKLLIHKMKCFYKFEVVRHQNLFRTLDVTSALRKLPPYKVDSTGRLLGEVYPAVCNITMVNDAT